MPVVLNVRDKASWPTGGYVVYVGRPTVWGNPFVIGRDGTRAEVIAAYEAWLVETGLIEAAKRELRGHDLACHCAPLPCHADVLLRIANEG
jgi:hypothetical protein